MQASDSRYAGRSTCSVMIHGQPGTGKRKLVKRIASDLGIHCVEVDCFELLLHESNVKRHAYMQAWTDRALASAPCILFLRNVHAIANQSAANATSSRDSGSATDFKDALATMLSRLSNSSPTPSNQPGNTVMVMASTVDIEQIHASVRRLFRYDFKCEAPSESFRKDIISTMVEASMTLPDVDLDKAALQTAGLSGRALSSMVASASIKAVDRILEHAMVCNAGSPSAHDIKCSGIALCGSDFASAIDTAREAHSDQIGAPKIPNVQWEDIGGLGHVKDTILSTIKLPLEHPELFATGAKKRSGILLYGPPGTGKTLVAKAVATTLSLNFFSVKGPELLNMYIGESEANVRRVFQRARDARPCVVFFDELDSVAPKRGEKGDSGGVMDRIVSQMLAELDGMADTVSSDGSGDVFVIGATNRPDLLDPALLRPGR
eukprot:jgi/Hompol1/1606/HPOL_005122-RA